MRDPDIASLIRATANNHRQRWVPAPYLHCASGPGRRHRMILPRGTVRQAKIHPTYALTAPAGRGTSRPNSDMRAARERGLANPYLLAKTH